MSQVSRQVAELIEKALALPEHDRELIIDRLVESLEDGAPEQGVEAAWADEIKSRVEEIQSGRVEMIPGEEMDRWLAARLNSAKK